MKPGFILLITLWSLYSCQSLGLFSEQFLKELKNIKPSLLLTKEIENGLINYMASNKIEKSHTVKSVDLNNIYSTCNLDFEISLVQTTPLPASNNLIAHINIGGLLIPGMPRRYVNKWACTFGVVIKNNSEFNSVYSLIYNLSTSFNLNSFMEETGLDLSGYDERELAKYIFYTQLLDIYNKEIFPVKQVTKNLKQN